jgi:hypothetical protein
MDTTKRHFKVVIGNTEHGLYISSSPSSAARKAVSKLCADDKKRKVKFYMREITNGSKKKTYGPYLGEMKKLAKPIELKGRVIRYKTEVVKINEKKSKQKGGTRALVLKGNNNPYKTIVLQYDCCDKKLNIYLSIHGATVIPNFFGIEYTSLITAFELKEAMAIRNEKDNFFTKDYLVSGPQITEKPLNEDVKQYLLLICKRFCEEYTSNSTYNSEIFIKLITKLQNEIVQIPRQYSYI